MQSVQTWLCRIFLLFVICAFVQCANRGNPTGGPKDITPPQLLRANPDNFSTEFKGNTIQLTFDEFVKLNDIQKQLVISPPLKYRPEISPQGGSSKEIEITFKDTLLENTTYTINFGQAIVDNNEGNPLPFLTYVFSTGTYLDSLTLGGIVKDAQNRKPDDFISVMLYALDSAFADSTIYSLPPKYITNTLDSTPVFELKNLKAGSYRLLAVKDKASNNFYDPDNDKIGFVHDTVVLPTDSLYLLNMFKEEPRYFSGVPSLAASNKIIFGYRGKAENIRINTLTPLPDSVRTLVRKNVETDTLNYWITAHSLDSLQFTVEHLPTQQIDSYTVRTRRLDLDSLVISASSRGAIPPEGKFYLQGTTPISKVDTSMIRVQVSDSLRQAYDMRLDSLQNKIWLDFPVEANTSYRVELYPEAITDFFGMTNDSLEFRLKSDSYADYGNMRLNINGAVNYPILVELLDKNGKVVNSQYNKFQQQVEFSLLQPGNYGVRVIFDENGNGKWDTGNYKEMRQPEPVKYYPQMIEIRANWEREEVFTLTN